MDRTVGQSHAEGLPVWVGGMCQDVTSTSTSWHQHPVGATPSATPWAEAGLWACRRGSLEVTCSQGSGPDPAPSSTVRSVPVPGRDIQHSPALALEARLEPAAKARPSSLLGHPTSMCESVGPASCLLGTQPGRPAEGRASCLLPARSRWGIGLTPLSREQFKNCWKGSTGGKNQKVSVKTCLVKGLPWHRGTGAGVGQLPSRPWSFPHASGNRQRLGAERI